MQYGSSIATTRATTIAIAIVRRAINLEREPSKKKQRTDTKKDAKRIKSDNFTRSNRENLNDWMHHNYLVFWHGGSNNIFADCIKE